MITLAAALVLGSHVVPRERYKADCMIFLLRDCPIANQYMPEINRIQHHYSSKGVAFTLVFEDPDATQQALSAFQKSFKFEGAMQIDPKHTMARIYRADVSPTAVVHDASHVFYVGRIDDTYASISKRRTVSQSHDLRNALDAVLGGKKVKTARTTAVGCRLY